MLLSDYDWAENGVLELARQIQSEYWALVAYSLFISITAFLDVAECRSGCGRTRAVLVIRPLFIKASNFILVCGVYRL